MKLPNPAPRYDVDAERRAITMIEEADRQNLKRGADIEIGDAKLVIRSPNGARWKITVSNAGVVAAVAL